MNARKGHTKEPVGVLQLPPHSAYLAVKVKPSDFSTAVLGCRVRTPCPSFSP